jgi:hypothetical protein
MLMAMFAMMTAVGGFPPAPQPVLLLGGRIEDNDPHVWSPFGTGFYGYGRHGEGPVKKTTHNRTRWRSPKRKYRGRKRRGEADPGGALVTMILLTIYMLILGWLGGSMWPLPHTPREPTTAAAIAHPSDIAHPGDSDDEPEPTTIYIFRPFPPSLIPVDADNE